MSVLLDASALLAVIFGEAGSDTVVQLGSGGCISAVNLSEVFEKVASKGGPFEDVELVLRELELKLLPFNPDHAKEAARLKPVVRGRNVAFADRACLVTARCTDLPVLTGDRVWISLDLGIDIRLIR